MVAEETTPVVLADAKVLSNVVRNKAEYYQTSSAGVDLAQVNQYLDNLYPPSHLQGRNALSRTDGYWPFVHDGKDPPASLTYGEFDVASLAHLLEEALSISGKPSWEGAVFTDLGSGAGRVVQAAAVLHDWSMCRGVELLPGLHTTAVEIAAARDHDIRSARDRGDGTWGSAVELRCGSFEDEYFGDSDVVFSFSTCMNGETMERMANAVRRQCRVGTVVITTDYPLPTETNVGLPKIKRIQHIPTWCQLLDGDCIAYVHQLVD